MSDLTRSGEPTDLELDGKHRRKALDGEAFVRLLRDLATLLTVPILNQKVL
jgi:hypothetical protein